MIRLLWTASTQVRYFLRRYMPSNIILDLIRTRNGLKWASRDALAAPTPSPSGTPHRTRRRMAPPVALFASGTLKMMAIGPVSVVLP
ncbi:MAG: sulfate permease [Dehalococcoidia bacterium]|nr:sulfate permease [Dehalococcoidia bacterium]